MQLPGKGVWGPSVDPDNAVAVIETAIDHGVNFIDTADAYGRCMPTFICVKRSSSAPTAK